MLSVLFLIAGLTLTLEDTVQTAIEPTKAPLVLHNLPFARSRFGLPDNYEPARELFTAAEKDFQEGKFAKAGPKFISVAQMLKAPSKPTTYSEQYAVMRLAAYQNAELSFGQAGDKDGALKALNAALKDDPENKEGLKALISKL